MASDHGERTTPETALMGHGSHEEAEKLLQQSEATTTKMEAKMPSFSTATTTTTTTTSSPKQPPPEKPSEAIKRFRIVLSFWFIVLVLGLPIWWRTTTIYRAKLPLDRMLHILQACRPAFPLPIAIRVPSLARAEAAHLVRLTQHALDDLDDFSGHHLRLQLEDDPEPALTVHLSPGEANAARLDPEATALDLTYASGSLPPPSAGSSPLTSWIAGELRSTFAEEQAIISHLLSPSSGRAAKSLRYAPTYHLTLSLFTAGAAPSTWDVEEAVRQYLRPALDVLRPMHNFTLDTQVQLYATPGAQAPVLAKEHLASFINAAEWPLSPSIGGAPTVNFVVFVGNQTIELETTTTAQSWTIPQWGSVYLLALPSSATHVSREALRLPMLTFAGQLLTLLGTPRRGSLPLRLSALGRIRSTDLLLRASSSLGALARLARALPSISIPRSVADGVSTTLHHLELACAGLGGPEGLRHARIAEEAAERAFFEKSMVGQLYFPDEHKIAVYLPLLGPVGVPLVLGLVNEAKRRLRRRRALAAEEEERKKKKAQ
ncbi:hypothetical protein CDD80_2635 [Ophiocordyceps camponoti-rufipedis]|uniref:GPI transamidase component PIG-S n=1 Tax=Ophiocordyceps camponoti-rufipedis TaxID=2004952 RepID=A0A2C5Z6T3_9HYPO|nr:hypothetical protein CDD80_2635 [Ophiocordyceps camponoti-rufipedis]